MDRGKEARVMAKRDDRFDVGDAGMKLRYAGVVVAELIALALLWLLQTTYGSG
jgi:hypothetical protein